jgi:propanediol dehydratase small subunit
LQPQTILLLVLLPVIAAGLYFVGPKTHATLGPFWARRCEGRAWKQTFPQASNVEIRLFLEIFVDAFALPQDRMLRFAPADQVLDVYRAINSPGWPDSLELETLDVCLRQAYDFDLRKDWKVHLTLGELFAQVHGLVA